MRLPRWLVALFVDREFDQQMRVHDDAQDMRRLEDIRNRIPAPLQELVQLRRPQRKPHMLFRLFRRR
jgi:hypothetical protein